MRDIEFLKPAQRWQPGDIASFSEADAAHYVKVGAAKDVGQTPIGTPRIPHPGEPGYVPEKHAVLHGEPIRDGRDNGRK